MPRGKKTLSSLTLPLVMQAGHTTINLAVFEVIWDINFDHGIVLQVQADVASQYGGTAVLTSLI